MVLSSFAAFAVTAIAARVFDLVFTLSITRAARNEAFSVVPGLRTKAVLYTRHAYCSIVLVDRRGR